MNLTNWKGTAELIGIAAIVASLIFVGMQLRQDQKVALAEIFVASESSAAMLDLAVTENIDIWLKSKKGELLDEKEKSIVSRLVASMYRRARLQTTMRRSVAGGGNAALMEFASELHSNPGARKIWEAQIDEEVAQFERMRPGDDYRRLYRDEILELLETLKSTNDYRLLLAESGP